MPLWWIGTVEGRSPELGGDQPGLRVVPPAGKASKDWMVRLSVAAEEAAGVKNLVFPGERRWAAPPRPHPESWMTSEPTPT